MTKNKTEKRLISLTDPNRCILHGNQWERIVYDGIPIYIQPDTPNWFVPNTAADSKIQNLNGDAVPNDIQDLLKRLDRPAAPAYDKRSHHLSLQRLKECWIHITNRCNLSCRHCMFASGPGKAGEPGMQDEMTVDECIKIIDDTLNLGCNIFYFTGGEPLLHPGFHDCLQHIFTQAGTHVVVLSNLTMINSQKDLFESYPRGRLHFQVSVDGSQSTHDHMRGKNAFQTLTRRLKTLQDLKFPTNLAMTVMQSNLAEMSGVVDYAAAQGIGNIHFLWLFKKGNAKGMTAASPREIFPYLMEAQKRAELAGIKIDNIEIIKSQVFSCPGARYDLSNAGWESLAIGPDKNIYPTPAQIYTPEMKCGCITDGIENVWRNSQVLKTVRDASLNQSESYKTNPFRYILGGGDIDHSLVHKGSLTAGDPYVELYSLIAQSIIAAEARKFAVAKHQAFRLKMGEKLGECPAEGKDILFTHSNCVLSLPGHDSRTQVNQFYTEAAMETKEDIRNPICYDDDMVSHIPREMQYRSYGCGSPIMEANLKKGEIIVDLGSGTGIECFIAGKLTGPHGQVFGIDMGDAMLEAAERTRALVAENLGYDNITFKKSFLESLPLDDRSVDLVISNCVINLSSDKRRVFSEIYRVLKPGGRLIVSDITYNQQIPLEIKYNQTLRGECIGGALNYHSLFGLLNDTGFSHSKALKGYHYRTVAGFDFYSITYQAVKPENGSDPVLFIFQDFDRMMEKVASPPTCSCFVTPETPSQTSPLTLQGNHHSGCMVCGKDLIYFRTDKESVCHFCGQKLVANAGCQTGHFVCDACHQTDAVTVLKQICTHNRQKDAAKLMQTVREHPHFNIHGPEHHALVPAVILTSLRNSGYDISESQIESGIQRGQTVAGGACAFMGACGAGIGGGIAFSILINATPYNGKKRQQTQKVTQMVLSKISSYSAPRCCQRDSWLALKEMAKILEEILEITLTVSTIDCRQYKMNKECIFNLCPLWPDKNNKKSADNHLGVALINNE